MANNHYKAAGHAGDHLLVDYHGCTPVVLLSRSIIRDALKRAARSACAKVIRIETYKFGEDGGVTGLAMLAESHISVHTWPETGLACIDIFMCGDRCSVYAAELTIQQVLQPEHRDVQVIERGRPR